MERFYKDFDAHFCRLLSRRWNEERVVKLDYGYIKYLVFERNFFPLEALQEYLQVLDNAVKNGSILKKIDNNISVRPNERFKIFRKEASEKLESGKFFTYVKPPSVEMDDNELIAIFYYDPAFVGFTNSWPY